MLYVSRRVGTQRFGIVDTDDGVEQVVGLIELGGMLNATGIEIEGVEYSDNPNRLTGRRFRGSIQCYQSDMYVTRNQVKLDLVYGIKVVTWRNMITQIFWDYGIKSKSAVLKLSDFGKACADCILGGHTMGDRTLTLVFDNFISFGECVIGSNCGDKSIKFDVRELTDDSKAQFIYDAVLRTGEDSFAAEDKIIDSDERKGRMLRRWGVLLF